MHRRATKLILFGLACELMSKKRQIWLRLLHFGTNGTPYLLSNQNNNIDFDQLFEFSHKHSSAKSADDSNRNNISTRVDHGYLYSLIRSK